MTQVYGSLIRDDSKSATPRTVQSLIRQINSLLWVQRATHEAVHDNAAASKFCLKDSVRLNDCGSWRVFRCVHRNTDLLE